VARVSRTTSSSTLVRNTLANGAGGMAGMAIGILITPFTISQLGLSAYGIWTLALTLSFAGGYAAMSDLGIEDATVRYVAEAHGDDDLSGLNRTVATTLAFFAVLGVGLAIATIVLASTLTELFDAPEELRGASILAFACVGGQLAIEMPSRALTAVLEGTSQYVAYQAVELSKAILFAIFTIVVLLNDWGVGGLGIAYVVTTAASFVAYWVVARRTVPDLRVSPFRASWTELKRLLSYGTSVFVFRLTGTLYRQMDKLILGVATEPRLVALYEIANKIHLAAALVQSKSTSALVPATAQARRDIALLRDMVLRGTSYTVAASLPFTTAAIVFAEPLLRDWIGPEAVEATSAAQLFLVYLTIVVFHRVGTTMLVALGTVRQLIYISLAITVVNLVVSLALVGPLGLEGVLLGTLVATIVGWVPELRLVLKGFELSLGTWLRRILVPQLLPAVVQVGVLFIGLALVGDAGSLILDGLWLLLSVFVAIVVFVRFSIGAEERGALIRTLKRAVGRGGGTDGDAGPEAETEPPVAVVGPSPGLSRSSDAPLA
jgi:O-antigen/teichoic acid export membrane protein